MWMRSAFWIGRPRAGCEAAFTEGLLAMVPAMQALPGVRSVQALWPRQLEDDPPAIACQFMVAFASRADVDRMLQSPQRAALRPRVLALLQLFDGRLSHIEYEVLEP